MKDLLPDLRAVQTQYRLAESAMQVLRSNLDRAATEMSRTGRFTEQALARVNEAFNVVNEETRQAATKMTAFANKWFE